ncbi:uncharacterized protein PHACADRAFT_206944 [Phanerochaete carnosa HHB-10118-sp]|uniref:WW domain-containing protein n=1 Tax=Phanerochaete carnosa (strain HHB-10118-sp) TaxID=650164 RepID=K5W2K4_PHACS|nr:uncharacterized protein PHACADRAFT_206944 [Phanerochaete carnosa HHB-10118-sp]EKM58103.1 hypothetical protein PHACADRAFT_206944 [Phanerochaete carnosa HHB-10118-sp]
MSTHNASAGDILGPGGPRLRKCSTRPRSLPIPKPKPTLNIPRAATCPLPEPRKPPRAESNDFGGGLGSLLESPTSMCAASLSSSSLVSQNPLPPQDDTICDLGSLSVPILNSETPLIKNSTLLQDGNISAEYTNVALPGTAGNSAPKLEGSGALEIEPFAPQDCCQQKYHRSISYPSNAEHSKITMIQPGQVDFERPELERGWKAYECPEGKLLFYDADRSLLTMTNLYEPTNIRHINIAGDLLLEQLRLMKSAAPDSEIVISKGDGDKILYYAASMSKQCIFWFEEVPVTLVTDSGRAVVSQSHLEKAIRAQFWQHVEMFPNHRGLPGAVIRELKDTFMHGLCDYITSQSSMFPYDSGTIEQLSKCFSSMQENVNNPHNTAVAARLLNTIYKERFLQFFGEPGARLDREDSALDTPKRPRSLAFNIISPWLFFMPFIYLKELERTYVDNSVHYFFWRQFISGLKRDWENSITPATVLLSANVGFLSINTVDVTNTPNKSAAQIMSYISSLLSLFIYIVSQILSRHHRHHAYGQADKALDYILKRENRLIGLQGVAIAFSLPVALFLWSMLTFLMALMFVFFERTGLSTKLPMATVLGFLFVTVLLLLYFEGEGTISELSPFANSRSLLTKTARDSLSSCRQWWARIFGHSPPDESLKLSEWSIRRYYKHKHASSSTLPGPGSA